MRYSVFCIDDYLQKRMKRECESVIVCWGRVGELVGWGLPIRNEIFEDNVHFPNLEEPENSGFIYAPNGECIT
jgi:hypothetical protein